MAHLSKPQLSPVLQLGGISCSKATVEQQAESGFRALASNQECCSYMMVSNDPVQTYSATSTVFWEF